MNLNLKQAIAIYACDEHRALAEFLQGLSKDNVIAVATDLLTWYFNDKNSSTLREYVTTTLCGYRHEGKKLGYNGYKQIAPGRVVHCEVKPANFDTEELRRYREGERKTAPAKLSGSGSINDYTHARFKKDRAANLNMLFSGFVDGRLMYIVEAPFNAPSLLARLQAQLDKRLPAGDKPGEYLRGASINFKHYQDSADARLRYLAPADVMDSREYAFAKGFVDFLHQLPRSPAASA